MFATAIVGEYDQINVLGDGDLWPSCWSDDDHLYTAWGDGFGFGPTFHDIGVARITGHPRDGNLAGQNLALSGEVGQTWTPGPFNRKPTGMLCVGGDLYLAVQDLSLNFDSAPAVTIAKSTDKGESWQWDGAGPMFRDVMTTMFFADFGKAGEHRFDDFAYVYGLDHNWRDSYSNAVPDPTALWLARVPLTAIQDRAQWTFFAGLDAAGEPTWTPDIEGRVPVLEDTRKVYDSLVGNFTPGPSIITVLSQGGVVYDAPLDRYLFTSWTEYTFELYEAPKPWGPWTLFLSKDYGAFPWGDKKNGGYGTSVPSKYISDDGKHMYIQSNTTAGGVRNYTFSLRDLRLERWTATEADNLPGEPIPTASDGAVPIAEAFRIGLPHVPGDGSLAEADFSWTGEDRPLDHWGFTWPRRYRMNRLTYTTGDVFPDGGWFDTLAVEVRQHGAWVPVSDLAITPDYPFGGPLAARTEFTLRFAEIDGDGVRIIGAPGGPARFTSIAELAVGYDP